MIGFKGLLINILLIVFSGTGFVDQNAPKDCDTVKVTYTVAEGEKGYSLKLSISGGASPYKTILSKENGNLVSEDFSLVHFESLSSGKYTCVVFDSKNCKRKLEITVP